ncbi:MAG: leucine-rich repeat protein [Bacteroidales bacterium]|jgi:hypothetical protein|nr:leucine-rich repeat protein [Bacteroidales bacterium]
MKKVFLFIIVVCAFCMERIQCQIYDFSAVNNEGYTLYYKITSDSTVDITDTNESQDYYLTHGSSYANIINEHLTIPSNVSYNSNVYNITGIAYCAFAWCNGLQSITIPNMIKSIDKLAFGYCNNLTTLNFNAINAEFHSIVSLPHSPGTEGEIRFLPVFKGCNSLTEVNIGDSVKKIPANFINNCTGLNTISIPDNVDTIGNEAFRDCPNLIHISLGSGIKYIGQKAFNSNPLGSIICSMTEAPMLGVDVFNEGTFNDARVVVPCNTKESYQNADGWRDFKHLIDPCVDLEEANVEAVTFNLYPNPATTELNISSSQIIETIEVFNILGQRVYASQIKNTTVKIDITNFKSGNYIAKINTNNGITIKKFIVQ